METSQEDLIIRDMAVLIASKFPYDISRYEALVSDIRELLRLFWNQVTEIALQDQPRRKRIKQSSSDFVLAMKRETFEMELLPIVCALLPRYESLMHPDLYTDAAHILALIKLKATDVIDK